MFDRQPTRSERGQADARPLDDRPGRPARSSRNASTTAARSSPVSTSGCRAGAPLRLRRRDQAGTFEHGGRSSTTSSRGTSEVREDDGGPLRHVEPVFVPRDGATAEDDGWLMVLRLRPPDRPQRRRDPRRAGLRRRSRRRRPPPGPRAVRLPRQLGARRLSDVAEQGKRRAACPVGTVRRPAPWRSWPPRSGVARDGPRCRVQIPAWASTEPSLMASAKRAWSRSVWSA